MICSFLGKRGQCNWSLAPPALPELPRVSPAEWPDKVTDGESLEIVEEAAILAAPGAVALFQRFTCKLPFGGTC